MRLTWELASAEIYKDFTGEPVLDGVNPAFIEVVAALRVPSPDPPCPQGCRALEPPGREGGVQGPAVLRAGHVGHLRSCSTPVESS